MRSGKRHAPLLVFALIVILWMLSGCASQPPSPRRDLASRDRWVEATLSRLTLKEKISQMVMSRSYGYYYSDESDEYRRLERLVKERKVGGLIFFQGDVYETAVMINRMQKLSDVPLLIASDFEWGSAMRIRRATRFPEAMAVGATRDTLLAFQMGKVIAQESRAIGVHQDFAPVADVNVNPENPVINTRSFGEDPYLVASMATAFTTGLQSGGVLATAKHFPGHGDTETDSHLDLPIITATRARIDSVELLPYKSLVAHGLSSVMIAHLEVPSLEPKSIPSTLSSNIVAGILQRQLGFDGLIVTDALDMAAVRDRFGPDSAAVRAVEAGVDVLLIPTDEDQAVNAVADAVTGGRIPVARIDRSVRKILNLKWQVGISDDRFVDIKKIPEVVATQEHLSLAKEMARRSVTLVQNNNVLPLEKSSNKKILDLIVGDVENYRTEIQRSSSPWPNEPLGDYFTAQLRKRYSNVETFRYDPSNDSLDVKSMFKRAKSADVVLMSVFSKARSGSGKFGLPDDMMKALDSVINLKNKTIVLAMGSPYTIGGLPGADAYICSYSDAEIATEATIEALFGEIPVHGKLPVTIPKMFSYGTGIDIDQTVLRHDAPELVGFRRDSLARIDSIMNHAIADHAFPGGEVVVAKDGSVAYDKSFGRMTYNGTSSKVDNSTLYDLASLTKVIATTTAVMKLYDEGKLGLDDLVTKYIPQFANHGKDSIRVRNLLVHNAGLPPFKRLFLTCTSAEQVLDSVYQTEMIYRTGDSSVYSDFDFILLGKIIEKISGTSLDKYVADSLFKPLGMTRTMYKPPQSLWENTAPTEYDSLYRKRLIRGEVHDENAYALDEVSGHAGLFSTASDLAIFMQMLMNGGNYGGRQYIKSETVKLFTARQDSHSTRALGWDTKTMNGYSSAGTLFSGSSFGHTGFTGTSVWADPEKKIFVILLTNRVYPTRNNSKIQQIRPAVSDAVVKAISK